MLVLVLTLEHQLTRTIYRVFIQNCVSSQFTATPAAYRRANHHLCKRSEVVSLIASPFFVQPKKGPVMAKMGGCKILKTLQKKTQYFMNTLYVKDRLRAETVKKLL